jgi:ribosomal protein L23
VVDRESNKVEIKRRREKEYGVTVDRRAHHDRAWQGQDPLHQAQHPARLVQHWKKAIVTLKKGENIDLYSAI